MPPPPSDPASDDEALIFEARRLHERYTVEVIERFDLCPFARRARQVGAVERFVLLQSSEEPEPTLEVIRALEARPDPPPVAIVIYPRLGLPYRRFDDFAARIKERDQARHGGKPVFVSATFHPDYPLDPRSPASLVPFFRRSPDPSLQLVSLKVLEDARGAHHGKFLFDGTAEGWQEVLRRIKTRSVTDRIGDDNRATFEREGAAAFESLFADLRADRARTYARFGLA